MRWDVRSLQSSEKITTTLPQFSRPSRVGDGTGGFTDLLDSSERATIAGGRGVSLLGHMERTWRISECVQNAPLLSWENKLVFRKGDGFMAGEGGGGAGRGGGA